MKKHHVAATAGAALAMVALVPSAALAYEAPGYDGVLTDPTPVVGEAFGFGATGVEAGQTYTLTVTTTPASIPSSAIEIAGTKTAQKVATGSTVSWDVSLTTAGSFSLAIADASGAVLASEAVTVAPAGTAAAAAQGSLAQTGSQSGVLAAGAAALVLGGAGAVVVARRRHAIGA
ncbi:LPXTG cell wall anchor domain-containing protein [Cellulomonas endophytica]|uniref:LPXTG cell wall anchor domain-containing protein n=1 Tax=Cellulomonas endophytica TaxID=2494735 RepID=UPI001011E316|nr:LPXTG cell wall anchor domain-containing protein [Cellulomonas endophytica]